MKPRLAIEAQRGGDGDRRGHQSVAVVEHQVLEAAGAEHLDEVAEADEGGQRALRLGVVTALQCSARCVEIGFGGAVEKHQPAAVLDEERMAAARSAASTAGMSVRSQVMAIVLCSKL